MDLTEASQIPRPGRAATRRRKAGSLLVLVSAALAFTAGSGSGATASPPPTAAPQVGCGVRVYMTASGPGGADATNDASVKTSLETNTDLCVTVGVNYYQLSTVSASVTLTNYDVIYVQGQNNWSGTYLNQFDASDYAVLDTFLTAGGGVVFGEWHAWNACAKSYAAAWGSLDALMPVTIKAGCAYQSNVKVRFYRWSRPLAPLVDTGVAADFVFEPADFAGSLSELTLKSGATPYYYALWNSNVNNIPAAVDPAQLPSDGGVGMAGWVPAGKSGRVFAFATTNGAPELLDTTAANSFRRLLLNSLGWAGSVGGSINPDTVTVNATVGGAVSTQSFVPSRIVGTVSYSVVSGTLPTGLNLNTSTGQITGTISPTSTGGNATVTIQATGQTSGQAQASITFVIPVVVTTTTAAPTTTTVAPTTTIVASPATTAAPTTTVAATQTLSAAPSTNTTASLEVPASASPGSTFTVVAKGFTPGEKVTIRVGSSGRSVTATAGSDGTVTADVLMPAGSTGSTSIVVLGATSGKTATEMIRAGSSALPVTGGSSLAPAWLGLAMLALGVALARRRRIA
jgi:LPXTG-motif cell wall-anchored protein